MRHPTRSLRPVVIAVLATAVLATSGCHWFTKDSDLYTQAEESRPLEVPPDLNLPDTSGAMPMPAAPNSVSRSSMATPAASTATNSGFTIPGDRDDVFNKLGEALAATEGVTIASKAQILGAYDVDFEGSQFLMRVTKVEAGVYISAVDPRGMPATTEAPLKLVASLKAAMGH